MTDGPPTFSVICAWCQSEVVSFADPPAMVDVVLDRPREAIMRYERICTVCLTDLIKWISKRAARPVEAPTGSTPGKPRARPRRGPQLGGGQS